MTGCLMDRGRGKPEFQASNPGEYYRIACPFCLDTRHRLWINHRWGVGPDGVPNERLIGMPVSYTNVFWGGRSEIKPSEISPVAYTAWCREMGVDPRRMRA